jgi:tetratricopeptide (TPR) repeat protein
MSPRNRKDAFLSFAHAHRAVRIVIASAVIAFEEMGCRLVWPVLLLAVVCDAVLPRGVAVRAEPAPSRASALQDPGAGALSRQWRKVPSANFTAVGDAPASILRAALKELEVFRTALSRLSTVLPTPRHRSSTPLVVVFRNDSAFEPYKPRDINGRRRSNVGGYYFDDPQGAYIVTAAGDRGWGPRSNVVLHEYAHEVFHDTLGTGLPPWLDEGLAELCASVGVDAGSQTSERLLGRPIASHVASLRRRPGPNLPALLSTSHAELARMAPDDAALFYAKSWALVHYVLLGRDDRGPGDVPAFLAALAGGRSPLEAFESAFRLDGSAVDAALAGYIRHAILPAVPVADPIVTGEEAPDEPMLESEVDQIQGTILLQVRDLAGASERLDRAFARSPESAALRLSLARLRTADFQPEQALQLLTSTTAEQPSTYATELVLGRAQQRAGRYADALDAFGRATTLATPALEAWYGMSLTALLFDRPYTAADAMSRLQSIDPTPAWYFERARDMWEAGRDDLVVADIQTLLTHEVSDTHGRAYAAFIGVLSARRLARTAVADDMLARVESNALERWPSTLVAYLQGRLAADEVVDRARGVGQLTEAHAYIGISASVARRPDEARRHLAWVRDRGVRAAAEYDMSRVELTRLD